MSPLQLNEILQEIKAEVPEINAAWLVVDDSMLTKNLSERPREDNIFLIGVLPNYGIRGANVDAFRNTAEVMLLILEKTDYSEHDQDSFIDIFERTYHVAKKVQNIILRKATEECMPVLQNIFVDSVSLEPEWKKAECNGWNLNFSID